MAETNDTCTVAACDRDIHNKTLRICRPHYNRYWRTGDVQADKPFAPPRSKPKPSIDHPDGTRTCLDCEQRLPIESFHRDSRGPLGRRKTCKACRVATETERYWADPDAHKLRMRQHRQDNLAQVRARDAARYIRNRHDHIARSVEAVHRRRALIAGRERDKGITVVTLRKIDGDLCCYCGDTMKFESYKPGQRDPKQATLEHHTAISKGGSHTWGNCALACWDCNIRKGSAIDGWTLRLGHRLAPGHPTPAP